MSGSRIKIAGRFKPCVHMGCFDLETFVELNQRSRKVTILFYLLLFCFLVNSDPCIFLQWQCPICLKNYSLDNIIIDPYFNRVASLVGTTGLSLP